MQTTSTPSGTLRCTTPGQCVPMAAIQAMHNRYKCSMIKCRVTIKTATGSRSYSGIFTSTMAATIDAMDLLADSQGRISVKVLP